MEQEQKNEERNDELVDPTNQEVSLKAKVWFWLTCWRPVTKYELASSNQAWLKMGMAILQNHKRVEDIILNMNTIVRILVKKGILNTPENAPDTPEQSDEEQEVDEGKKPNSDVMFN